MLGVTFLERADGESVEEQNERGGGEGGQDVLLVVIWKAKVEDAEVANTKKATSPAGTGHQVAGNRTLKTKREPLD